MKQERDDKRISEDEALRLHPTTDTSLQTPEEHQHDQNVDVRRNNSVSVSEDDLHETKGDRLAGTDRDGTAERKP